ncbi:ATP-binding cassette, subfamily C, CydCD [Goodfellowiella coeruleoviolacea]|uniref:ATP-binding cassette, subfamily C, CydCD n=1 Tax=Goodfellowiella coeruleoviolacea TaxID=334858 RepID=A0AAE3GDZ3_9PSEU|nr:ATP-binding cassette, subfamily C, CydCD [Goodfellowiella coeruleoviolacea]
MLAALHAVALVAQAVALGTALAQVAGGGATPAGLRVPLAALAGAVVVRAVLAWATESVAARAAAGAKEELRAALLDHVLALGPEWIARRGPAEVTVLATRGLDALDAYFTRYLPALVTAVVTPPLVGAWILVSDWPSAALVAVTLPLIPVFAILVGWYTQRRSARAADATARLSGHLLELVRALPVLTAFRRAGAQADTVRRVSDQHRGATMGTLRVAFLSALVLELVATLSVALVAVGIGLRLVSGELGLVTGLVVLILAPECYLPLRNAGAAHHASEDGLEAVRRVAAVLAEPVPFAGTGTAPGTGTGTGAGAGAGAVPDRRLGVVVRELRVARRGGAAPDGLSFVVRPGHVVRLSTPSGSGKSTALAVLLGFVEPTSGTVTVGGADLSTVDMVAWRRAVAWVPQRPAFSGGTVAEELCVAVSDQPGPPPDRAELDEVAAEVAAGHLIDRRVATLSTGERQRVAVARALLRLRRGAWLLLLDEPTAHLDQATASTVLAAVRRAAQAGAAVVLATHRVAARPDARGTAGPGASPVPVPVPTAVPVPDTDGEPRPARPVGGAPGGLPRRPGVGLLRQWPRWPFAGLPRPTWLTLVGVVLGAAALASGIALTATAGWLIARAAQQPPILTLSVAVVGVRAFGLAKGVLRYLERLVTHDAAFRQAGQLRVRLWRALVRHGPARTGGARRDDDLRRLVDDTDTVRDLVPRVVPPPLVALLVCLASAVLMACVLPETGAVLAVVSLVVGLAAPAVAVAVERRASSALAAGRARVAEDVLTLLDCAPDLIACGAHAPRRSALAAADRRLAAQSRRQALGAGAASAVVSAGTGIAALVCTALAAVAVAAGRLDPVLAPLLGLVPLAVAEALAALPPAAQHLGPLRAAHARLTALLDSAPAVDGADAEPAAVPAAERAEPGTVPAGAEPAAASAAENVGPAAERAEPGTVPAGAEPAAASAAENVGPAARETGPTQPATTAKPLVGAAAPTQPSPHPSQGGDPSSSLPTHGRGARGVEAPVDNRAGCGQLVHDRGHSSGVLLDGVDVWWPGAAEPSLRDVTLDLPQGATVAVVGPSGAGKSTLLALLLGFLPARTGHAKIPDRVTWCPQEPQLVSTTIRENLRMADPHADDAALRTALRLAGLDAWTDRLDTLVGTGGAAVSGGEAHRLALARALVAAPRADLVLLDEPTAHLDVPTADAVLDRLRGALAGRTVIHVTHRPAEAADADLVLEVVSGRVRTAVSRITPESAENGDSTAGSARPAHPRPPDRDQVGLITSPARIDQVDQDGA